MFDDGIYSMVVPAGTPNDATATNTAPEASRGACARHQHGQSDTCRTYSSNVLLLAVEVHAPTPRPSKNLASVKTPGGSRPWPADRRDTKLIMGKTWSWVSAMSSGLPTLLLPQCTPRHQVTRPAEPSAAGVPVTSPHHGSFRPAVAATQP